MKLNRLFVLILIVLTGCDLDRDPWGISDFWNVEEDLWRGLSAAYQPFYEEEGYGRGHFWAGPLSDDMVFNRTRNNESPLVDFLEGDQNRLAVNNSGPMYENWQYMYRVIRRANDVIKNEPNIEKSEKSRDIILGEANFLCAYSYFYLAKRFGGLPFHDPEAPAKDSNKPRETLEETYNRIEAYLFESIKHFENQNLWTREDKDWGRPNLGAAYGLLAKLYAHWAVADQGKYYLKCKEACEKVIGKYSLNTTDGNGFAHLFSLAGEKHEEVLFNLTNQGIRHRGTITSVVLLSGTLSGGTGWYYFVPTESLNKSFDPGDKRHKATVVGLGDEVNYLGTTMKLDTAKNAKYSINDMETTFMCNKYVSVYGDLSEWQWESGKDIPLLRYADVLLLHAEAEIFLAGGGPDNRNLGVPAAATSFNEVRLRAFGGDQTKAIAAPTFNDLVKERRCELAYEDERHYDLVRWGLAQEVYLKGEGDPRGERYFNPEIHNYLALPQREIDNTENVLVNNPLDGYSNFKPVKEDK